MTDPTNPDRIEDRAEHLFRLARRSYDDMAADRTERERQLLHHGSLAIALLPSLIQCIRELRPPEPISGFHSV